MKQQKNYYFKRIILFLSTLVITCSVILTRSFIDVYADDYDYIPIDDIEQYNAYRFFSLYGYKLDYTNTISYSQNYSGSYTYEGTVSGTISGSENSSFGISLTGTMTSADGEGGTLSNINLVHDLAGIEFRLHDIGDGHQSNMNYACTFSNPNTSVGAYSNMECHPTATNGSMNTTIDFPDFTLTLQDSTTGSFEAASVGQLFITLAERETGTGSLSGTLYLNESESESGSGTISLNGSSSTTGHKTYDIPSMTVTNLDNSIIDRKGIYALNSDPTIICFLTPTNNANISIYNANNEIDENIVVNSIHTYKYRVHNGYYLFGFEISGLSHYGIRYIKFNKSFDEVIPLYVGLKSFMSDKLYRYIYGSDRTYELLDQGTSQSQAAGNNLNNETSSFSDASNDLHEFEINMKDNMNDALNDIDTSGSFNNLWTNNGPLQSMNWVKLQFDRLIAYDPIKKTLIFSLTLGIALTILGKLRNK